MLAFGARITDIPSDGGRINQLLIKAMIARADEMSRQPDHWFCDQLNNPHASDGYVPLGEELWEQSAGHLEAFVHAVSTSHSLHGVTRALWRHNEKIRIVAVEPAESAVLSGGASGSHRIEGIGIGFIPPLWMPKMVNEIQAVSTEEARDMARRLAREEGVFAGTSSGANVVAAIRVAQQLGPTATVATLIIDSGLRYLSRETATH
jgi:cysteine synthase A